MREIKFRAWDKKDKRMIVDTQNFIPLVVSSIGVLRVSPTNEDELYSLVDVDRFDLMQYTGLKDKNGVEIYEGDIVEYMQRSWNDGGMGDNLKTKVIRYKDGCFNAFTNDKYGNLVIGNIYENPELLDEQQR